MTRWRDLDTDDALRALSAPLPTDDASMTRRRFLKAAAATAGATAAMPAWLADVAAAATPIGPNDGVLVIVQMNGGNDGLNTIVPTEDGTYRDKRGALAVTNPIPVATGVGLHPNLPKLAARYAQGQVALLQGVGDLEPDMSHFTAMARWMAGQTGNGWYTTGWLGRWLDGHTSTDDLSAVVIGSAIPLSFIGAARRGTALPVDGGSLGGFKDEGWITRSIDCLRDFGAAPTGYGALADALGTASRVAVDLGAQVRPLYAGALPEQKLERSMELAARLINANLGVRVIQVQYGDFDSHSNQPEIHDRRMAELDAGIDRLFATLAPTFGRRTTVLTISEFGRRPERNASNGTDHGEGSDLIAVGPGVKGGLHGEPMHLGHLSEHGCPIPHVDFRSVYATVLDRWLGADSGQILGARYEHLPFLGTPSP